MATFVRFKGKGSTGKLFLASPREVQALKDRGEKFEVVLTGRSIMTRPRKKGFL
jgi:hypothetical protein|tara:strand:+ start:2409 stop:2570 length:162 start_codon:yes stop_codon:yes gene_type:complete